MKRVWKALALIAFLAIGAYGLTQFLEAHHVRAQLADAERACSGHGGVGPIETEGGAIISIACEDGTPVPVGE